MRRQTADGTSKSRFRFKYRVLQRSDIDAAAFIDLDNAVVIDVGDDQTDAVKMRVQQQRFCRLKISELGVKIAVRVLVYAACKGREITPSDRKRRSLAARDAVSGAQIKQNFL